MTSVSPMTLDQARRVKLPFGRHRGRTLGAVLRTDFGWFRWLTKRESLTGEVGDAVRTLSADADIARRLRAKAASPSAAELWERWWQR